MILVNFRIDYGLPLSLLEDCWFDASPLKAQFLGVLYLGRTKEALEGIMQVKILWNTL